MRRQKRTSSWLAKGWSEQRRGGHDSGERGYSVGWGSEGTRWERPESSATCGHLGRRGPRLFSLRASLPFLPDGVDQVCGHWSVPSLFFPRHNLPTDPRTSTASLNSCSWFERAHSIVINIYILRLLHRAFLNQHLTAQHREATTIWLAFSNRATLKVSPPTSRSILLAVSHGLGSAPDAPCSHNRAQALPSLWTVRHLYSPSRRAN